MGGSILLDSVEVAVVKRLILVELLTELALDVFAGEVQRVPLVVGSWLVDLLQCLFVGANFRSGLQGRVTGDIAEENGGVVEKLSELAVGEMELAGFVFRVIQYHSVAYPFVMINSPRVLKPALASWAS